MMRLAPFCLLLILFFIGTLCYWPGLRGGFLFDDYPNLSDLGVYGGVINWETFKGFVLNGWSGPTGRPMSLASFLLDDNTWPSHASWFKVTNLLIHMVNGLMLCWCALLLLRTYGYAEEKAIWIAILASAFWFLHPYFVSTTLYVVQRMAQLATLFSLMGMLGYLQGRRLLSVRPRLAYILMTISVCLGTLLATFSKENGVLLPLLILLIEFCNPTKVKPLWQWRLLILWLPSAVVAAALAWHIDFSANPWPNRPFNQVERLLSETRIVTEYLYHLWIPRIEGRGLYQDGYQISKGFLSPVSTLFATVFLAILLALGFTIRKKYPLLALAIFFFFVGHLVESTVIGLELYFEHRNYLSALFLFLPLAALLVNATERISVPVVGLVASLIIAMLALMTWQRAQLWSDSEKLELYWAAATPDSPRAQASLARHMSNSGRYAEAEMFLEDAARRLPNSALLTINALLQKIYTQRAMPEDFVIAGEHLARQPFDAQTVKGLRVLVEHINSDHGSAVYREAALQLIEQMEQNAAYNRFPLFLRLTPYLKGQIFAAQHQPEQAYAYYSQAIDRYNDTEAALMMVAEMAERGYFKEAMRLLDQAELLYEKQSTRSLKRSRTSYDYEIKRLRSELERSASEA
jgi:tetratricopeptide (TPR) repeat protein